MKKTLLAIGMLAVSTTVFAQKIEFIGQDFSGEDNFGNFHQSERILLALTSDDLIRGGHNLSLIHISRICIKHSKF